MTEELFGARIWEIQKNGIPKEIGNTNFDGEPIEEIFDTFNLDLDNKTYAIRIGKEGLK